MERGGHVGQSSCSDQSHQHCPQSPEEWPLSLDKPGLGVQQLMEHVLRDGAGFPCHPEPPALCRGHRFLVCFLTNFWSMPNALTSEGSSQVFKCSKSQVEIC